MSPPAPWVRIRAEQGPPVDFGESTTASRVFFPDVREILRCGIVDTKEIDEEKVWKRMFTTAFTANPQSTSGDDTFASLYTALPRLSREE